MRTCLCISVALLAATFGLISGQETGCTEYGDWSNWSQCSSSCNAGQKIRRKMKTEPKPCQPISDAGQLINDTATCANVACAPKSKCADNVFDWSDWSHCPNACGLSVGVRNRTNRSPNVDGCGSEQQQEECDGPPCFPADFFTNTICGQLDEDSSVESIEKRLAQFTGIRNWLVIALVDLKRSNAALNVDALPTVANYSNIEICPNSRTTIVFTPHTGVEVTERARPRQRFSHLDGSVQIRARDGPCQVLTEPNNVTIRLVFDSGEADSLLLACDNSASLVLRRKTTAKVTTTPMSVTTSASGTEDVDCVMAEWLPWTQCSTSCGLGTMLRFREIETLATGKGKSCPEAQQEEKNCMEQDCFTAKDCRYSPWSEWLSCSATCQPNGRKSRLRSLIEEQTSHSEVCTDLRHHKPCNEAVPCSRKCTVSEWTPWAICSVTCGPGGLTTRSRIVLSQPEGVTEICPPLKEKKSCTGTVPICPRRTCKLSEWLSWSVCTVTCGDTGVRGRLRVVRVEPEVGAAPCPHLVEESRCPNMQSCPSCTVTQWLAWGDCSATCGRTGVRSRNRQVIQNGPTLCLQPNTESGPCNRDGEPCDRPCELSEWQSWAVCSKTCGKGGEQKRERDIVSEPIANGEKCPELKEVRHCDPVIPACPRVCKTSTWSDWSCCADTIFGRLHVRNRTVVTEPSDEAAPCPRLLDHAPCPVADCNQNCQVTHWLEWTDCSASCNGGIRKRRRTVKVLSKGDGKQCPVLQETDDCNTEVCVDCKLASWSVWSCCLEMDFNEFQKNRTRVIISQAIGLGRSCPNPKTESNSYSEYADCYEATCPIDCQVGDWTAWSTCSVTCGKDGQKTRTRSILIPPKRGGRECPLQKEAVGCDSTPECTTCQLSSWTEWSCCTPFLFNTAIKSRNRTLIDPEAVCPVPFDLDHQECPSANCPVNCVVADWGVWSACSITCGTDGQRKRSRQVVTAAALNGTKCPSLAETSACNPTEKCPWCQKSDWTTWNECSVSCGDNGWRSREQKFTPMGSGDIVCPNRNLDKQKCHNSPACPKPPAKLRHLGCYENPGGRCYYLRGGNSPTICSSKCQNVFALREYRCCCSSSEEQATRQGKAGPYAPCNSVCTADSQKTCGGKHPSRSVDVYAKLPATKSIPKSSETHQKEDEPMKHLGCYYDSGYRCYHLRADNSPARCAQKCPGVFALRDYRCCCSSSAAFALKAGVAPASGCSIRCRGDSTKSCGGRYNGKRVLDIYRYSPVPSGWKHHGCHTDPGYKRCYHLKTTNSPAACAKSCARRPAFALRHIYCCCDESLARATNRGKVASASACTTKCVGDNTQNCGGRYNGKNVMNIYGKV